MNELTVGLRMSCLACLISRGLVAAMTGAMKLNSFTSNRFAAVKCCKRSCCSPASFPEELHDVYDPRSWRLTKTWWNDPDQADEVFDHVRTLPASDLHYCLVMERFQTASDC